MRRIQPKLAAALKAAGAVLKRTNNHMVYQLPNGRTFVVGSTPSDHRATENALHLLERTRKL